MKEVKHGTTLVGTHRIKPEETARTMGSGDLDVYATPALVALMELTAKTLVASALEEGETTVGTHMDLRHTKAAVPGEAIRCVATLLSMSGRKLSFEVEAFLGEDSIGKAVHERYVVDSQRFMASLTR